MHIITSTTRSLSSQHKRLNDETTNVSSRKIIFPSISPRPPEKRSVKNLNDKKKKKNPFLPVTYRQFRDSDIVRARVLMRRDYYIISTPKISIINPAYRFLFALLQNSRWNHVPTCALFAHQTAYNYKRTSNACNHDIRSCKHARYNGARTCAVGRVRVRRNDGRGGEKGTIHSPAIWANVNQSEIVMSDSVVTMQWPERVRWSFHRPAIRVTVMDRHSSANFSRPPPPFFFEDQFERLRNWWNWYLLPGWERRWSFHYVDENGRGGGDVLERYVEESLDGNLECEAAKRWDEMVRRQILITFFRDIGYRGENFEMTMTNGLEIRDRMMRFWEKDFWNVVVVVKI